MIDYGILVVSFGTTYKDAEKGSITSLEEAIRERFSPCPVYKAYTSNVVRRILSKRGEIIPDVKTALLEMKKDGIKKVCILPTLIIYGEEFEKIKSVAELYQGEFEKIVVGPPLLKDTDDMKEIAHILHKEHPAEDGECLVLMGHGTRHYTNMVYPAMEYICHEQGMKHIFIGTIEAYPELNVVIQKAKEAGMKKIVLIPFMFVAGDHAINDMAGEEDSWKTEFEKEGFQVKTVVKGLGEYQSIREVYMSHIARL